MSAAFLAVALLLQGCQSGQPVVSAAANWKSPGLYVSIGDSYAAGYQPTAGGGHRTTRNGFAYQIADRTIGTSGQLQLANFGCSGDTSTDLLERIGCDPGNLGPDAQTYPGSTQAAAAVQFLEQHRGQVALVTVVIGGNDVNNCFKTYGETFSNATVSCVKQTLVVLRNNLSTLLPRIRNAAGSGTSIVGLTYPDIYLGAYVKSSAEATAFAQGSVPLFRDNLNPMLKSAYSVIGATFADITGLMGAYGAVDVTTSVAPFGALPGPVAQICILTYFCQYGDLHPTTAGHRVIADAVMQTANP